LFKGNFQEEQTTPGAPKNTTEGRVNNDLESWGGKGGPAGKSKFFSTKGGDSGSKTGRIAHWSVHRKKKGGKHRV